MVIDTINHHHIPIIPYHTPMFDLVLEPPLLNISSGDSRVWMTNRNKLFSIAMLNKQRVMSPMMSITSLCLIYLDPSPYYIPVYSHVYIYIYVYQLVDQVYILVYIYTVYNDHNSILWVFQICIYIYYIPIYHWCTNGNISDI